VQDGSIVQEPFTLAVDRGYPISRFAFRDQLQFVLDQVGAGLFVPIECCQRIDVVGGRLARGLEPALVRFRLRKIDGFDNREQPSNSCHRIWRIVGRPEPTSERIQYDYLADNIPDCAVDFSLALATLAERAFQLVAMLEPDPLLLQDDDLLPERF
jgi:hypothetical protein